MDYGLRNDKTAKGFGYFGELKRPDGQVSTEISVGVDLGDGEMEIPTLVPTLSRDEVKYLLGGGKPTESIMTKAVDHAVSRKRAGRSAFADKDDKPVMFK